MPKIKFTEVDNTGSIQPSNISNTVFVPIKALLDDPYQGEGASTTRAAFAHIKSLDDLKTYIGDASVTITSNSTTSGTGTGSGTNSGTGTGSGTTGSQNSPAPAANTTSEQPKTMKCCEYYSKYSLGYKLCAYLLTKNLDVLVTVASTFSTNWDELKDKGLYDIRFLTLGDLITGDEEDSDTGSSDYGLAQIRDIAEARGDCIALYNLPLDWDYTVVSTESSTAGPAATTYTADADGDSSGDENQNDDPTITEPETPSDGDGNQTGDGSGTEGSGTDGNNPSGSGDQSGAGSNNSSGSNNNDPESEEDATPTTTAAKIQDYFSSITESSYVACFAPNFYTKIEALLADSLETESNTTDSQDADKKQEIPAAFGYLFAYADAIKNNPEWYAIAGFQRGVISELTDVCYDLSSAEMDVLQCRKDLTDEKDNNGTAINPIANIRPAGYIIYGNRTFKNNVYPIGTTAQSFLNVRNMVSGVVKKFYDASRKFTFEPNNDLLWIKYQNYVTPYLDSLQTGNGILGYKLIKQPTTAKARLKCKLIIVPVEAVEDFEINIILTDDMALVQ